MGTGKSRHALCVLSLGKMTRRGGAKGYAGQRCWARPEGVRRWAAGKEKERAREERRTKVDRFRVFPVFLFSFCLKLLNSKPFSSLSLNQG
jgi:hypothetical protein